MIIRLINYLIIFCAVSILTFCQPKEEPSSDKIKVLIIDGFSNHDWKQTTSVVKLILEESGLFSVNVSTAPETPNDIAWGDWNPALGNYDVVIQNTNNIHNPVIKWPNRVEKALEDYVSDGGGLYILHSANNAFPHWSEYNKMIGLGWRSEHEGIAIHIKEDGQLAEIPIGEGRSTYHGPRNDEVINILNEHPINKNFPKAWKTPDMELYKYARGPAKNLTVLSYANEKATNINWPVEWTISYGKGHVYNSSMGHLWKGETYPLSYQCIGFQTTLIRATEWLATGKTSYPLPHKFPSASEIKLANFNSFNTK
ncbi:MAG: ThuA domain-containing protein [Reichenbachiella sp.]